MNEPCTLTSVLQVLLQWVSSIKKFCEAKDCNNYGIVVHALKSSSRMIGAAELSEVCAQLEKAADSGEVATIQNETAAMLERTQTRGSKLTMKFWNFYRKMIFSEELGGLLLSEVEIYRFLLVVVRDIFVIIDG
ncbi:MAG: Hpt domain-containing protein [Synergistaceae bacterium]|nr:Hpt domain-containing protein [Synergistaceae bacterium]